MTDSPDNTARLWDAVSGEEVGVLKGHSGAVTAASFSFDGKRVLTGSHDNTARVWDADSSAEIVILKGHSRAVCAASFSPDGRLIITGSDDKSARLWDADSGAEIAVLRAHSDGVCAASFSPSGKNVLTGSDDMTARIFDISRCATATRVPAMVVTAALGRGIGWRTSAEAADLLMQDAPDDLFAEALRQLGRPADDPELQEIMAALRASLHSNCYLSPTQFAEKFDHKKRVVKQDIESKDGSDEATVVADSITPIAIVTTMVAGHREVESHFEPETNLPAPPLPRPPRKKRPRLGRYDQRSEIAKRLTDSPTEGLTRTIIAAPALDDRLKAYEDANADAMKAQNRYRRLGRFALLLMTLATLVSACLLFPVERLWPESGTWRRYVSGAQSAANLIALLVVSWLKRSGAVARWMSSRAEAERLRGDYFRALLLAPAPAGAEPKRLLSEKLALFETAHLDYQRGYFKSAIRKHAGKSLGRRWPGAIATVATIASIGIGALAAIAAFGIWLPDLVRLVLAILEDPVRWQLGLNTMGSALLAYSSARAMLTQDERNAALYTATLAKLDTLRTPQRREAVAKAAAAGDEVTVLAYAAEVQTILDADHQAWMLSRPATVGQAPPPKFKV